MIRGILIHWILSSGVEFNDKLFVNFDGEFFPLWQSGYSSLEISKILLDVRNRCSLDAVEVFSEHFGFAGFLSQFHNVTDLQAVARDVDLVSIDQEVTMVDHLSGLSDGISKSHTVYHVVKSQFKHIQKLRTSLSFGSHRSIHIFYELFFEDIVVSSQSLLFKKLSSVLRQFFVRAG